MTTTVGRFEYIGAAGTFDHLEGHIETFTAKIKTKIVASPNQEFGGSGTHRVFHLRDDGSEREIGHGSETPIRRGPNKGGQCLIVRIDDPSFIEPLKCTIFKKHDHAIASLYRKRIQPAAFSSFEDDEEWT